MARHGNTLPSTKGRQKRDYRPWTDYELKVVLDNPLETAESLGDRLGRTPAAVAHVRSRHGRMNVRRGICWCCDARPVWEESREALRMGLCKGCYFDELECREKEEQRDNAYRQRKFKSKRKKNK